MDSFFARNRLSAYLDRTLPKAEAEAVAEAIARDIALSADVQAMHKTLNLMQEAGRMPAPTGFHARTMAAIAGQPVPGSQVAWLQRRIARIPTELVALAGAALIMVVALNQTDESASDEVPVPNAALPAEKPQPTEQPLPPEPEPASVPVEAKPAAPPPRTASVAAPPATPTPVAPTTLPYDAASPLAYRILSGGDQVLYDIATLADETNGRLVNAHGKLFTPYSLSDGNSFAAVYLVTNEDNAPSAHKKLLERSGMEPYPLDGPQPPMKEGETVFMIEAQL